MIYKKYLVREGDHFNPDYFPTLIDHLDIIIMAMAETSLSPEALVSYVKNHSTKADWVNQNPELTVMLTLQTVPVNNLEAMFDSCSHQAIFREELEDYILLRFKTVKKSLI